MSLLTFSMTKSQSTIRSDNTQVPYIRMIDQYRGFQLTASDLGQTGDDDCPSYSRSEKLR